MRSLNLKVKLLKPQNSFAPVNARVFASGMFQADAFIINIFIFILCWRTITGEMIRVFVLRAGGNGYYLMVDRYYVRFVFNFSLRELNIFENSEF